MIVMMEEGVNHACLQNVQRILRIDSYIPTYSIGKKTFVFFSLQHHFISCKNIWISLISICTSWISLTIVHAVNGSVSTQCPKGFEHIVCLKKNIILTASWPELPLHILTRQSLGSAWLSSAQLGSAWLFSGNFSPKLSSFSPKPFGHVYITRRWYADVLVFNAIYNNLISFFYTHKVSQFCKL